MGKKSVVFVGISDYDNLGVGYMSALLSETGYRTKTIDLRAGKPKILKILKKLDPLLIGFSIIFLNHIKQFNELINYLRREGLNCHFTAGGHYASLKYEELFQLVPQLDSVIRFEGEYPILELVKCISNGSDWRKIDSLTFKENHKIISNRGWPLEKDLDKFPFPLRSPLKEYAFKKKFTAILAGRGCVNNCSFCNTRQFYCQAGGPVKRIRKPEKVVSEMNWLFHKKGCSVFLFHDDDFPVKPKRQTDWIIRFCNELKRTGLNNKIVWKINCRPDEVEEETFALMKRNGLYLVFLGLEDGTDSGLKRFNKRMTVTKSIKAVKILKKLKIGFDYGFMLFQPETTFRLLNKNLDFLTAICGDGYTPVTFLKLIPLYDTRVEKELKETGRLIQSEGIGDYEFPEQSMNLYFSFIMDCFGEWLRSPQGVENVSKWARNYCLIFFHYFYYLSGGIKFYKKINRIISESNIYLLDKMKELSELYNSDPNFNDKHLCDWYKEKIKSKHDNYINEIINTMAKFLSYVEDQKIIINT